MKLIKTDKYVGGLHEGTTILDTRVIYLEPSQVYTINSSIEAGVYTLEIGHVIGGTGGSHIEWGFNGKNNNLVTNSGWQFDTQIAPEGSSLFIKNAGPVAVQLTGVRFYPGKVDSDKVVIIPQVARETKEPDLNGWYIEVDVPLTLRDELKQGYILYANTKSAKNQPFRIHNIEIQKRRIRIVANHVLFDTMNMVIPNVHLAGASGALALTQLNEGTDRESPFTVSSTVEGALDYDFIMTSYYEALQVLIDEFEAKLDVNGFHITLRQDMGEYNGVILTYGEDIQDMKVYEQWDGVCTRIFPRGPDGLTLPEKYLDANVIYDEVYAKVIEFQSHLELETKDEDGEDIDNTEVLLAELREQALSYLETNKFPKIAYIVSSNIPQKLNLWDTVYLRHPAVSEDLPLDMEIQEYEAHRFYLEMKVTKYEYDILADKVVSIEYGNFKTSMKDILKQVQGESNKELEDKFIDQEERLKEQTDRINNLNKNGHVVIEENEIYIVDALPKEKAQDVLRMGVGGIGFSSTGITGDFSSAWGLDGEFNASYITAGVLEGALLRVGSIQGEHLSVEAIDMILNLAKSGGANIIKNSVGYGGYKYPWASNYSTPLSPQATTWILRGTAGNGWVASGTNSDAYQSVNLTEDVIYTMSAKVLKPQAVGQVGLSLERYGRTVHRVTIDGDEVDGMLKQTFTVPETGTYQIRLFSVNAQTIEPPVQFTDFMLKEGTGTEWQQANGEVYGADISFDADGIKVQRIDIETGRRMGYTIMSPQEFAGYYDGKRVFSLNADITEVEGLDIGSQGLYIQPIKMVQNLEGTPSLDIVWTGRK